MKIWYSSVNDYKLIILDENIRREMYKKLSLKAIQQLKLNP
ncbi:hypothetical protein [Clostridium sp. FP1]|nr:hypothetical protein [Clostridium sp. FP1]